MNNAESNSRESNRVDAPLRESTTLDTRQVFRRVFPGVMVAMFLAAADQTILASALPTIASSLGGFDQVSWVVVAYLLAATIAAPIYGHLGDRFGRRRMLFVALAVFTLASFGCAVAPTLFALVIARAVQGLGGGGLMTLAQAVIGEHVAPRERGRFAGYFAMVFALATTSGPVVGAYLTEQFSWRAVFVINLPLGLLAAILAARVPRAHEIARERFRPDIVGALLLCATTLSLLFLLSTASVRYGWISTVSIVLLATCVIALYLLIQWEKRAYDPIISPKLFAIPAIARSDAIVVCFAAPWFAIIVYWPLYLQLGQGLAVSRSGLMLLPMTLAMVSISAVVGRGIARTGRVTVFPQIGFAVAATACATLAVLIGRAPIMLVHGLTVLVAAALGAVMPAVQVIVQLAAGRERLGAATASISLCRSMGGALGVAIAAAILLAVVGGADGPINAALREMFAGDTHGIDQLSEGEQKMIEQHLARAYQILFVVLAAICSCGALIARNLPKPDWNRGS
jgi:EmrB/QacA subfamily drug resistance transporter